MLTKTKVLTAGARQNHSLAQILFLLCIGGYQEFLSPFLGRHCRFEPSCSQYMKEAILKFGPWKGLWAGAKRLLRCHPLSAGGYDPLPESMGL